MGIDLNTIEEEDEEPERPAELNNSSPAFAAGAEGQVCPASASVCLELWHACAGPLISLPKKGSLVVYFPQGHFEQMGEIGGVGRPGANDIGGFRRCDMPPQVFCRVVDVKLHADAGTDEVYAQLSLLAENEEVEHRLQNGEVEGDGNPEEGGSVNRSAIPHMFCKTLTASDTSTHGGFSVPRRAAEDCFPPLDYKQQRPSQELVAKDLHGMEWRFRHIYRGQPRRHLLTTGWSAFVNRKKLVSGDAVLFLRGNDGQLRLGVRRAAQFKTSASFPAFCSGSSSLGTLATVANSVFTKSVFHIYYNPRANSSEFIVPHLKFSKSLGQSFSVGMRFKMRCESEDASERRSTGIITGISDMDPIRWPGSRWRCLMVKWDDDLDAGRQNRISPWEIEPTGSVLGSTGIPAMSMKRAKTCLLSGNSDFPVPNGSGCPDLVESSRFHKVLQGQELMGFGTPFSGVTNAHVSEVGTQHYGNEKGCSTRSNNCIVGSSGSRIGIPLGKPDCPFKCIGFDESIGFPKVLQGQEVFSSYPPRAGFLFGSHAKNAAYGPCDDTYTSDTGSRFPVTTQGYSTFIQPSVSSIQTSSPSSVLMFHDASSKISCPQRVRSTGGLEKIDDSSYFGKHVLSRKEVSFPRWSPYVASEIIDNGFNMGKAQDPVLSNNSQLEKEQTVGPDGCRLFGFSLTEKSPMATVVEKSLTTNELRLDAGFSTSTPQIPANPVGHNHAEVGALYALCAAPF